MLLLAAMALIRGHRLARRWMLLLLLLEIISINAVIALNGAASNPFNAILLLPSIMACVWLSKRYATAIVMANSLLQVGQWTITQQHRHHDAAMLAHSQAMVISFIITSVMIMAVIFYLRARLAEQESQLQSLREKQLRNEQLLAIGTAAAQLTHDLATPAQSAKWLIEEGLEETQPTPLWLTDLEQQFGLIQSKLASWRTIAEDVRNQRLIWLPFDDVWRDIQQLMQLARPEAVITWSTDDQLTAARLYADRTLLPALSSIIVNACDAQPDDCSSAVAVSASRQQNDLLLQVANRSDIAPPVAQLGQRLVASDEGHGAGAVISNATLEKFGGQLRWQKTDNEVTTWITLPLS